MKKLTTIIAAMAAVLLTGACNKAEVEHEGSAVTLDYTVSLAEAATKAIGDGATVNALTYAIYDGNTYVAGATINRNADNSFSFTPSFYYGKSYKVVMFAYNDGAYDVDKFLYSIAKKTSVVGETTDAFTYSEDVMINHKGDLYINGIKSDDQASNHSVTLTRPVAQLAIGSVETTGAEKVRVTLGEDYKAVSYNAVLGTCAQGTVSPFTSEIMNLGTFKIDKTEYTVVACNYFFPMDKNVNVMIEVLNKNDDVIRTINLKEVPLVANKKTQIYGNLVKGDITFKVNINSGFKNEVNDKEI